MTLISLVIPCYNHGRFLPDAVASILCQSVQDFEIIIVDDASTDNTPKFCMDAMDMDPRVKAIRLDPNMGTASANNAGMGMSEGEYITVMSADDTREPYSFEKLYEACRSHPHHFAYDDILLMAGDAIRRDKVWRVPEYDFNVLLERNTIHTGIMFERRAYIDTGGYPEEFRDGREDWAFNLLLGTKGYCGIHVDYAGYVYRRHGANRTLFNTDKKSAEKFRLMIRERFKDLYLGRFPMACCGQRYPVNSLSNNEGEVAMTLVGAEGMTAVQYIGGNYGTTTFYGAATGTAYRFDAGANNQKMVDNRDLHTVKNNGLLDLREHTRALFIIASEQPPLPEEKTTVALGTAVVEPEAESASVVISEPVAESESVVESVAEGGIDTIISVTSPSYKKLVDKGITTIDQLKGETVESLVEKTGISKTSAKAILGAI